MTTLVLLDLSAAFDTVDHSVLLHRLQLAFAINGTAHQWLRSYLSSWNQYVRRGLIRSTIRPIRVVCGVPQGSVLGPILFVLYTARLISATESHSLLLHMYADADDSHVYGSRRPTAVDEGLFSSKISERVEAATNRMRSNGIQTKPKSCCTTGRRHHLHC